MVELISTENRSRLCCFTVCETNTITINQDECQQDRSHLPITSEPII